MSANITFTTWSKDNLYLKCVLETVGLSLSIRLVNLSSLFPEPWMKPRISGLGKKKMDDLRHSKWSTINICVELQVKICLTQAWLIYYLQCVQCLSPWNTCETNTSFALGWDKKYVKKNILIYRVCILIFIVVKLRAMILYFYEI